MMETPEGSTRGEGESQLRQTIGRQRYPKLLLPYEVYGGLVNAESGESVESFYNLIVDTILLPYEETLSAEPLSEETIIFFIGEPAGGKTLLSRQCTLKVAHERRIRRGLQGKDVFSGQKRHLTTRLLRYDDLLRMAKSALGQEWEEKTSRAAHALASYGMERSFSWARSSLPHPWCIVTEASFFPYPDRDLGGSALEAVTQWPDLNLFIYAVLPNKDLSEMSLLERGILEEEALSAAMVKVDARQREIKYRQSMATIEAMRRTEELVFRRIDRLIKEGLLPPTLSNFRGIPERESEARCIYYKLTCEQLLGYGGNFRVVDNPLLLPLEEIHAYNDIFDHFPHEYSLPVEQIMGEIMRLMVMGDESSELELIRQLFLNHIPETSDGVKEPFLRA